MFMDKMPYMRNSYKKIQQCQLTGRDNYTSKHLLTFTLGMYIQFQ